MGVNVSHGSTQEAEPPGWGAGSQLGLLARPCLKANRCMLSEIKAGMKEAQPGSLQIFDSHTRYF